MEQTRTEMQTATEICEYVCNCFVREKRLPTRRELIRKFESIYVLERLCNQALLTSKSNSPADDFYLPRLGAFALVTNDKWLLLIRSGMVATVQTLRKLFLDDAPEHRNWIRADEVLRLARAANLDIEDLSLHLGLLMLCQTGCVSGQKDDSGTVVTEVLINEYIVEARDSSQWVDEQIDRLTNRYRDSSQDARFAVPVTNSLMDEPEEESEDSQNESESFDWQLLHPDVKRIAQKRFEAGHFADAVEASLKEVEARLNPIYKQARGEEKSGADLMTATFSPGKPVLLLGDPTTISGADMQKGYMMIFAGAMTGIRNPKAHGNVEIDTNRAIHFLFLASLLMHKIDEAKTVS